MKVGDLVRYLRPNDGEPFDDTLGIVVAYDIVQPSAFADMSLSHQKLCSMTNLALLLSLSPTRNTRGK